MKIPAPDFRPIRPPSFGAVADKKQESAQIGRHLFEQRQIKNEKVPK